MPQIVEEDDPADRLLNRIQKAQQIFASIADISPAMAKQMDDASAVGSPTQNDNNKRAGADPAALASPNKKSKNLTVMPEVELHGEDAFSIYYPERVINGETRDEVLHEINVPELAALLVCDLFRFVVDLFTLDLFFKVFPFSWILLLNGFLFLILFQGLHLRCGSFFLCGFPFTRWFAKNWLGSSIHPGFGNRGLERRRFCPSGKTCSLDPNPKRDEDPGDRKEFKLEQRPFLGAADRPLEGSPKIMALTACWNCTMVREPPLQR